MKNTSTNCRTSLVQLQTAGSEWIAPTSTTRGRPGLRTIWLFASVFVMSASRSSPPSPLCPPPRPAPPRAAPVPAAQPLSPLSVQALVIGSESPHVETTTDSEGDGASDTGVDISPV